MKKSGSGAAGVPVIVTVPCFSGAFWDLDSLGPHSDLPLRTMRLPEGFDDVEDYADYVQKKAGSLNCYVLVGDSFGAAVSLALAVRRPALQSDNPATPCQLARIPV